MATFNPGINPTNDPSYLGMSQGTDKATLQPLASVPELSTKYVQPDYKSDTSAGTAVKGVGDLGEAALKLTDAVIQEKASDTLRKGLESIRDTFGVADASKQGSALPSAVGRGGAEGVSLDTPDPNAGQPLALQRMGNRVQGLQEAYRQGELSNSAYWAKLHAFVSQTKAQFVGYEDIIDQKVSSIVGTTPANALRSSLLNDVAELQKKTQAAIDKRTQMEHTDAKYIHAVWPNYEQDKANGNAPSWEAVQMKVGQLKAREWNYEAGKAAIAYKTAAQQDASGDAESLAIKGVTDIAGTLRLASTNAFNIKTTGDLQKIVDQVNSGQRPPLTTDEKTQLRAVFAQMQQSYMIAANKKLNEPLADGSTETLSTTIRDQNKLKQIIDRGYTDLKNMEESIVGEQFGLMARDALTNKATMDAAEGDFLRNSKVAAAAAASRKFFGDTGQSMLLLKQPALLDAMLEGYRNFNLGSIAQGNSSIREVHDTFRQNGQMDPNLWWASVKDTTNTIIHGDRVQSPDGPKNAVRHLFGPDNNMMLNTWRSKPDSQATMFVAMTSPEVTRAISKMDKESQKMYTEWANDGFFSVFQTNAVNTNQSAQRYEINNNLKLTMDPETGNFKYVPQGLSKLAPMYRQAAQGSPMAAANQGLVPLNAAINTMKDVWKLQGVDVQEQMFLTMGNLGINEASPVAKAVKVEYDKLLSEKVKKAQK